MINVVYLVLVFSWGGIEKIPQKNMDQCQANARNYINKEHIRQTLCIVGVK